jgi:glucokinase
MAKSIGVVLTDRVAAGLVEDHQLKGELQYFPDEIDENGLIEIPKEELSRLICEAVVALAPRDSAIAAVGIAMPGIVIKGVLEDSPNLPQLKGTHLCKDVSQQLRERGLQYPVSLCNDADAAAAGVAATRQDFGQLIRVWTIGNGIGFGRYPYTEGAWEGGHMVVTLDPKEKYCGCGGKGHLEGIMGNRAMRLRFLDLEPEEVFAAAKSGDKRCAEFVDLWHRALAAATASQIHLEGPGRFYYTGRDIQRLDLATLRQYLYEMVKMSPLQSYTVEVLPEDRTRTVVGAAVAAERGEKCV